MIIEQGKVLVRPWQNNTGVGIDVATQGEEFFAICAKAYYVGIPSAAQNLGQEELKQWVREHWDVENACWK